jgi:hypothetical protein
MPDALRVVYVDSLRRYIHYLLTIYTVMNTGPPGITNIHMAPRTGAVLINRLKHLTKFIKHIAFVQCHF